MILAGDIGGTKTDLALYSYIDDSLELVMQQQFASQEYATFYELLLEFIKSSEANNIEALSLGVAGPVVEGRCQTTNLPWLIEVKELQSLVGCLNVSLLNDLESTAYGMLYLKEEEFVNLNPAAADIKGNRAVIAAGTGLGEAMLYYDGERYHPMGSEGGHCDFAPQTPLQDELLVWLRGHYHEHVSVERILSGIGIATIYEFLKEKGIASESQSLQTIDAKSDKSAKISWCAMEENDPLSLKSMELFLEIYGAEAGNLALKSLSLGGLYIGGGIAPKILPLLENTTFYNTFINKGRFKEILQKMPLKVSLNPKTALLGAAHYAKDRIK